MKKTYLLLFFSIALLFGFIIYSNPLSFIDLIIKADSTLLLLAVGLFFVGAFFRVLKWKVLIDKPFRLVFPVQYVGMTISNFTPVKSAEPLKSVVLKAVDNTDVSKSFPTVIIERIIDLVVVVLFSLYALLFISIGDYTFVVLAGTLVVFVFIAALLAILYSKRFGTFVFRLLNKFPSVKISEEFINSFYRFTIKKQRIILAFLFTAIAWFLEGVVLFISAQALHLSSPGVLILLSLISLSLIISIASFMPGGIGSFEIVLTLFLSSFGVASAAAVVLLYRFLSFWFSVFLGGACFVYLSRKIDLRNIIKKSLT